MKNLKDRITLIQILIMTALGITSILFVFFRNELITVGGGFGWDGVSYGNLAKNFYNIIFSQGIDSYRLHRILPSFLIYNALTFFGIPKQTQSVVIGFEVYNLIMILISVYVWGLIADELKISTKGKWLGFIGLYVNFAILKWNFYCPVLTDATAFTLAFLLVYFFLRKKPIRMLIVMLLGNLTWANFMEMGLILLMFPRTKHPVSAATSLTRNNISSLFVSGYILSGIISLWFLGKRAWEGSHAIEAVVPLSVFLMVAFVYYATKIFLNSCYIPAVRDMKQYISKYLIIGLSVFVLIKVAIFAIAARYGMNSGLNFFVILRMALLKILSLGTRQPFIFFIAHVIFFGPILLLTFLFWDKFCRTVNEYGPGLSLFVFVSLLLSLNPESRTLINLFPVFVIFTVKALDNVGWKRSYYSFIGFVSIIYSKAWLIINSMPAPDPSLPDAYYLEFPWQKLFMNVGHFMSDISYIVQGSFVLITGVVFYFFFLNDKSVEQSSR